MISGYSQLLLRIHWESEQDRTTLIWSQERGVSRIDVRNDSSFQETAWADHIVTILSTIGSMKRYLSTYRH